MDAESAIGTSREARLQWIERLQAEWMATIRPFDLELERVFPRAPLLAHEHLRNCQVVPDRGFLVRNCLPKGGIVAEAGTFRGDFAKLILEHAAPRELHLIDITFEHFDHPAFAAEIESGRVRLHQIESWSALSAFPDEYFDWIYIDANHTYDCVRLDAAIAREKVKRTGTLIFDDYIFWSHAELVQYGVVHVVNELCVEDGWEFVWLALDPEMYCNVAIRRTRSGFRARLAGAWRSAARA